MPDTDLLDDLAPLGTDDPADSDIDVEVVQPDGTPDVHVCQEPDGEGICGASFDNPTSLKRHAWAKHRDRSKDKPYGEGARKTSTAKKAPAKSKKRTTDRAPSQATNRATGSDTGRAQVYASSISMAALGAYLAPIPFDTYDLDVVNKGAPNLASALDALGAQNPTVRKTCDLILGGGGGGAYLQLVLAVSAIAMPIMAHHGMVPDSTGARFGEMIGAGTTPPTATPGVQPDSPPVAPDQAPGVGHPSTWDAAQVMAFMQQVPETVMLDLAGRMMNGGVGPTVVDVPFDETPPPPTWAQREDPARGDADNPEAGSEQLAPTVPGSA